MSKTFREELVERFNRDELLHIIDQQNPDLIKEIRRIEYVFEKKLTHILWEDGPFRGQPIQGKPLTNEELALLIDEPFQMNPELTRLGLDEDQQRQIHISRDPVLWAKSVLRVQPRAYQIMFLRHPSTRRALRQGRRSGKSYSMSIYMLWWAYTHNNAKIIVVTPQKEQGAVLYKAIIEMIGGSAVGNSIRRKVTSPQHQIELSNGSCYSDDTEVLTTNGWKLFKDVDLESDLFATRTQDTHEFQWQPAHYYHCADFDGELYNFTSRDLDLLVTPNHRMLMADSNRSRELILPAEEAINHKLYWIPTTSKWEGKRIDSFIFEVQDSERTKYSRSITVSGDDYCAFMGMFLSEGSHCTANTHSGNYVAISQKEGSKGFIEMRESLTRMFGSEPCYTGSAWIINRKAIASYVNQFGGARDKFIPIEILEATPEQQEIFWHFYWLGDGASDRNRIFTSSPRMRDDLMELCQKMGYHASYQVRPPQDKVIQGRIIPAENQVDNYVVNRKISSYYRPKSVDLIPYSGKVYCVSVPNEVLYVRRNGKAAWCGNTIKYFSSGVNSGGKANVVRGQEAHLLILDEMDYMHPDDIDSLYAMMQQTEEGQDEKVMICASTPTGQRTTPFYKFCHFAYVKEFWIPALCFVPGQKIVMANGSYKNIEEIRIGDMVLTEKGPQKVLRTFERDYEGDIHNITTYGNSTPIKATPEHPFSSAPRSRKQNESYGGRKESIDWDWVEAKDLKVPEKRNMNSGSWLRYIYSTDVENTEMDLLGPRYKEVRPGRVGLKRDFKRGVGREFVNDFPRFIDLKDEALAVLCGWYLAEGHVEGWLPQYGMNGSVGWTFHADETDAIEEIQAALDFYGAGKLSVSYRKDSKAVLVRVRNAVLALLLVELCGSGSAHKQLNPMLLRAPLEFQEILLRTYAKGDGHIISDDHVVYSTISYVLASQVRDIGARLGWIASITSTPGGSRQINPDYGPYETQQSFQIHWNRSGRSMLGKRYTELGEAAFLVKDIQIERYVGKVYNFEVETTNSYVVEGLLVHNCNPHWSKKMEDELRAHYTENAYRHEIEADWGEDAEGVYQRKYLDMAFIDDPFWEYRVGVRSARSFYVMGVDWDKFGAGCSFVVLEVCNETYEEEFFQGKIRCVWREETPKTDFTYLEAIDRIVELHRRFRFKHIYIDRGAGEVQAELLHKYGIDHPESGLKKIVKGYQFAESIEVRDPETNQKVKKALKPFMVDNLVQMLEKSMIYFPLADTTLYTQLGSYVVDRVTEAGKPVFTMGGTVADHAHDALILACLAITQNYGDLMRSNIARYGKIISGEVFQNLLTVDDEAEEALAEDKWGSKSAAPVMVRRPMSALAGRRGGTRAISRKMF